MSRDFIIQNLDQNISSFRSLLSDIDNKQARWKPNEKKMVGIRGIIRVGDMLSAWLAHDYLYMYQLVNLKLA
jgi:hypothetical protein